MRYELIDRATAPPEPPAEEPPVEPPPPQAAFGPGTPFRPVWRPRSLLKRWSGQRLTLVRPGRPGAAPTGDQLALVSALTAETAARIAPTDAETVESTKLGLARSARRLGRNVRVWDVDGTVYAELVEEAARARRPRSRPTARR